MQEIMSHPAVPDDESPPKSKFVTVTAWVSIVYWALGAVLSTVILFLLRIVLGDHLPGFADTNAFPHLAGYLFKLMLQSIEPLLLLSILSSFILLIASIGLLQRHNWARILYVVMIVLLIVQNIIGSAFSIVFLYSVLSVAGSDAIPGAVGMASGLVSGVMYLALYAFVAWKLTRPDIRAEFH